MHHAEWSRTHESFTTDACQTCLVLEFTRTPPAKPKRWWSCFEDDETEDDRNVKKEFKGALQVAIDKLNLCGEGRVLNACFHS